MKKELLQIRQIDKKLAPLLKVGKHFMPHEGWIRTIRHALGMSTTQLGKKLGITRQGVHILEKREAEGSISIKILKETARVMDMQLVYAFIPNDSTLEALIERRAYELAAKIVKRTSKTMELENQKISKSRLKKAIEEKQSLIQFQMPKVLWD